MKIFIYILGACISFNAGASLNREIGCFSSNSKKINVKFVSVYDDEVPLSYVIYKNSHQSIPLVFLKKNAEGNDPDRPAEITTTWLEVIGGKINGQYTIMSQGARYYNFNYKGNNGKSISLNENLDAYNDNHSDCIWK